MLNKLWNDNQDSEENIERKRPNSQRRYQKAPDIITQVKPNNIIQPMNPHQSAFTPSNHSNKLNSEQLLLPPKSAEFIHKKTLILDLDETLVHSSFMPFEKNDIILNVDLEGTIYNIYVLVRPDAELFIKEVGKIFEVVIFTASISKYASPLLDILDKEKNIKYRLYRDHCTFINGIYIKDLKKCNRNLKDLMIVDNSPIAYTFDSDNGLPIKTWIEDPEDKELMKLLPILEFLSQTKDVRVFIDKLVYNNKILYEEAAELIKMKELIDKKNIYNIDNIDENDNNEKFTNNIKMIPKENIEDSNLNEEEINISNNNRKINNSNSDMVIKNRNNELKLHLINKENKTSNNPQNKFHEKALNTTKNSNKLINNISFNKKNINFKNNITNINYKNNNDLSIKINKISVIKPNNQKKGKKNIFRFKANERQRQQSKNVFNNMQNSNQLEPSLPLTLLLSNIAKRILNPKEAYQEISKNMQKPEKNNIKLIYKSNENNSKIKKKKYINLLEKYKGNINNKITISLINNPKNIIKKKMKNNYSMKNINYSRPSNLRVTASINNYFGFAHENKFNKYKEKSGNGTTNNKVTKSKSTENFLIFRHTIKHPKTPKDQHRQKKTINNKNIINLYDGINHIKTANKKIFNFKENYEEMHKKKKNKNIKK